MEEFKSKYSFEQRLTEAKQMREKYPDRIPTILSIDKKSKSLSQIYKNKYLVPCQITVGEFIQSIRKEFILNSEEALYFFVGDTLPSISENLDTIYQKYHDDDLFLYGSLNSENTFG